MAAITHFEVYALRKGRWTLHARYEDGERKKAVRDAGVTENATGYPCKVIRETYFPDINDSERITVYVSPRAKQHQENPSPRRRTPFKAVRAAAGALTSRRTAGPRSALTRSQRFFRMIVAAGISLPSATLATAAIAAFLARLADAGMEIASTVHTTILTFSYVVTFLLFYVMLIRSRLPLHRLLAALWDQAGAATSSTRAAAADTRPLRVKPKHDRPPSPEALRDIEELKVRRGDIDLHKPAETVEPKPAAGAPPVPAPPVIAATPAPAPTPVPEPAKEPAEPLQDGDETKSPELERGILRRFAVDIVKPAVRTAMPDDPVTRRAAAVVLAGAAAGVAATAGIDSKAEREILADCLTHVGLSRAGIDSFMRDRLEHTSAAANAPLLAAGRSAVAAYLTGGTEVVAALAQAMANWRAAMTRANDPPLETAAEVTVVPLIDVYVMTELREELPPDEPETTAEARHDQAMGAHNGVVRAAIAAHGGHEVRHTGKGIFARFPTADDALDAAQDMQRNFPNAGAKLAIGLIGNTVAAEDPLLTSHLVPLAQAIVAQTAAGEILCEAQVHAAIRRPAQVSEDGPPGPIPNGGEEGPATLAAPEPDFESLGPTTRSVSTESRSQPEVIRG